MQPVETRYASEPSRVKHILARVIVDWMTCRDEFFATSTSDSEVIDVVFTVRFESSARISDFIVIGLRR